ncbi:hypothetical protein [Fredinandcohnia quinoae]|uniref:Uncharacterized protein n=1 Tax=Fredinandcohnia quinoae TaxID=2918902 RepID=A0AAW5DVR6_9BACI|nr:hypothetical protein [Fredinandcohnia sp. SECRCQ15]MCH1624737.1 hypothetical protein [Fredinandcohnia sp. SECRCQ15]
MSYILEKANLVKDKKVKHCSILIKNDRVDYISENLNRLKFMRMELSNFLLTPGHIMINYSFSTKLPFQQFKEEIIHKYIKKGCTTLLVISDVKNENELKKVIKETKHYLLNSPIDYYIGIRIPLSILTPSLMVACRKHKIPVVITVVDHNENLFNIPWGWISESYFSYRLPIIPEWKSREKSLFHGKKNSEIWNEIMNKNQIPTISDCPNEDLPLSIDNLKKIGIYPEKGDIRIGGDLDYNLYDIDDICYSVDEMPILDYHKHIPKITMHKGKFLKVNSQIYFRSGFGNECKVKKPGYFVSSTRNTNDGRFIT